MGEVYRATDTRLGRDVALKVLPEAFAADAQRMARFQREAQVLASLNHPNIAAIYGLEHHEKIQALAMELVAGPTLAERIGAQPLPLDEALPIAKQIAEALEYAHEKGIIHRDLKPANIKLSKDGQVKVLDFGLAKALTDDALPQDISSSPTLSMAATKVGIILGTAAYMSPEQAKGKTVDRRADIWSFGVVLYEMLTGRQLYSGETASETMAAVIMKEPDLAQIPASTPRPVRQLIGRCLRKDPRVRLRDIGEARVLLEEAIVHPGAGEETAVAAGATPRAGGPNVRQQVWIRVVAGIVGVVATAGIGAWVTELVRKPAAQPVWRAAVPPPVSTLYHVGTRQPGPVAISPDGRRLAFAAKSDQGEVSLWVHSLSTGAAIRLNDTRNASYPFWSPDSQWLGFFADGKLKKVKAEGGPVLTLADAPFGKGGTWNREDVMIYAPSFSGVLRRIAASGGESVEVTQGAAGSHRYPQFLPDGEHFLYFHFNASAPNANTIWVGSLRGDAPVRVLESDSGAYYASGYLLYVRAMALLARPFDAKKLAVTGDEQTIANGVETIAGRGVFSVSNNGQLAYMAGRGFHGQLLFANREGQILKKIGDPANINEVELSPDGNRVAAEIVDMRSGTMDIWTFDVERRTGTRFAFGPLRENSPVWSPDGTRLLFAGEEKDRQHLFLKALSGSSGQEMLLGGDTNKIPLAWSRDGKFVLYREGTEIRALPMTGDRKPFVYLKGVPPAGATFSPDGRWVAHASTETGDWRVFVSPFPNPARQYQVSDTGVSAPMRWRADGKELFFIDDSGHMVSVEVLGKGDALEFGPAKPLFETAGASYFDTHDGKMFLLSAIPQRRAPEPLQLILNWPQMLKSPR